ncbi:hypothetical protein [Desulfosporosinus sp. SB140]|uniref:hypothetical protein n=1 Tax=Desulfosporosinus paludis TaxID=3115649 RepID=UPI00388EF777
MMNVALRRHSKFRFTKFIKSYSAIEKIFIDVNKNFRISALQLKTRKLGRKILDLLGPNNGSLFFEYERSVCLEESFCIESAYRLGLEERKEHKK